MRRVLFVCHGNICRSPMAELIFKTWLLSRQQTDWQIDSAGCSDEEAGHLTDARVIRLLQTKGYAVQPKRARQLVLSDYDAFDDILVMDDSNERRAKHFFGGDPEHKIVKLLADFPGSPSVADPWYTGDFESCYRDICAGLEAYLQKHT